MSCTFHTIIVAAYATVLFVTPMAVAAPADRIIHGGPIVTVNPAQPNAEAVAITSGRIVAVGSETDVMKHKGEATEVIDLDGRTLVPGFVDGHSHFLSLLDVQTQALCASPPAGRCETVADVIAALKDVQARRTLGPGKFVMGFGYDPELLAEKRPPTKQELDAAFPDNPVILVHVSGHGAMLNSKALAMYGVTAATPTPTGGVKVVTDGSPQGRTAAFTTPYLTDGPAGQKEWRGDLSFPQPVLNEWVKKVYDGGATLFVHCNGDAAIDALLEAHRFASGGDPAKPRGTVGIHSQFIRPDQLEKYKAWNITPSFFTIHCFYFGDTHVANRGRAQADFISPMKSARKLGMRPANHTDFNVAPLDQVFTIHTAVNRLSRSGQMIGADERITPLEALEAITIDGARLYGEEAKKGSIEVGKLADLVVLSANPLTVPPATLRAIRVEETLKDGKTVWKRSRAPQAR